MRWCQWTGNNTSSFTTLFSCFKFLIDRWKPKLRLADIRQMSDIIIIFGCGRLSITHLFRNSLPHISISPHPYIKFTRFRPGRKIFGFRGSYYIVRPIPERSPSLVCSRRRLPARCGDASSMDHPVYKSWVGFPANNKNREQTKTTSVRMFVRLLSWIGQ